MILRPSFSRPFLVLALGFLTILSGIAKVSAEDDGGISFGRVKFGKAGNDKWLTVDLRKTSRSNLSGRSVPVVRSSVSGFSNPRILTNFAASAAPVYQSAPPLFQPASTMVSNYKLLQAASIAVNNAHSHSTGSCWRYVKSALLKAEAIDSYPKTGYAKQAASELVQNYGFVRTAISNPFSAPIGSVLVYGGAGAGHIEIRTRNGFVSDFVSYKPSNRPLIGVFVKL